MMHEKEFERWLDAHYNTEIDGCIMQEYEDGARAAWTAAVEIMEKNNKRLLDALTDMFKMLDEGFLVRDITKDINDVWAIKMLPYMIRLKNNHSVLEENSIPKEEI